MTVDRAISSDIDDSSAAWDRAATLVDKEDVILARACSVRRRDVRDVVDRRDLKIARIRCGIVLRICYGHRHRAGIITGVGGIGSEVDAVIDQRVERRQRSSDRDTGRALLHHLGARRQRRVHRLKGAARDAYGQRQCLTSLNRIVGGDATAIELDCVAVDQRLSAIVEIQCQHRAAEGSNRSAIADCITEIVLAVIGAGKSCRQ